MIHTTIQRITIIKSIKPTGKNVNEELQWFGTSLGLFSQRDKDKSCFRIFIELLKAAKMRTALSSDELAARLKLTRGTVIHHLNKLIESGLVVPVRNKYMLRVDNLEVLIEEIKKDLDRTCQDLREVAYDIDSWLKF